MVSMLNEQQISEEMSSSVVSYLPHVKITGEPSFVVTMTHPHPTTQTLLNSQLSSHIPEVGLNPIVDAAAYLFSIMGRLIYLKSYTQLDALYAELVREIKNFQTTIEAYSYKKDYLVEYVSITCYALCATLDDIILSTPWGGQGKWERFSLVNAFIPEPPSQVSFFIILERLIRDPDIYIDVIEFMYLCLTFGFKCRNNVGLSEFDHGQLEQITHSLYKRIRAYRGNFSKVLSPLPIKPPRIAAVSFFKKISWWWMSVGISSAALLLWLYAYYF